MTELKDVIMGVTSSDYKERFRAEYCETKIRYLKLHDMIVKYEAGVLDFKPSCSLELLKRQAKAMGEYLFILELRGRIEKIHLPETDIRWDVNQYPD